jgi:DNA adenine methylase
VHRRWQGGGEAGGGSGVHAVGLTRQKPDLSASGASWPRHSAASSLRTGGLYDYLQQLAARLRRVRVCCGDWKRVLTPSVTTYVGTCGVFLDPPYAHDLRERCYSEDHDISATSARGRSSTATTRLPDRALRLRGRARDAGVVGVRRRGRRTAATADRARRREPDRERIWFSPYCQRVGLFDAEALA